jgi:hypothetical protein
MIELRWKKKKMSDTLLSYYAPPVLQWRIKGVRRVATGVKDEWEWKDVPEVEE